MYMCLRYATKSTLGHKTGKTTHRELELIGFVSVFDSASKSSSCDYLHTNLYHYLHTKSVYICICTYVHVHMGGIDECTRTFVYCLGYIIKSTLGHKTGKTSHRDTKIDRFCNSFGQRLQKLKKALPEN